MRRNKDLVILKQDKGKGVVLLDRTVYIEKCLSVLNTQQFQQLDISPTAANEHKIQRVLRKIKSKLTQQEYNRLYPTGSNADKFYGSAKLHKLPTFGTVYQLPLRPIISNIGTASYQLAKHLAKLLLPLSKNQCTINSTKSFMSFIKHRKVPDGHKMVSLDFVSLFTNFPLDATIEIILKRIHGNNEINTPITKMEMKELILLCTKGVHFTFDGKTYVQTNGMAMGSPLGPVLLGMFMVELENNLIHTLSEHLACWKRYVDDTLCLNKNLSIDYVISVLNSFHSSIQFTYEAEKNNAISFLDIELLRVGENIETRVLRKPTNTDLYIHWQSLAALQWKHSTLKTLVYRSYTICSNEKHLNSELKYLRKVFLSKQRLPTLVHQ